MKKKQVSLREFCLTGFFGPVTLGSNIKEVFDYFGEPEYQGDLQEGKLARYGWYEFFYNTASEVIFAIQNDHIGPNIFKHRTCINIKSTLVKIDKWFIKPNQFFSCKEVKEILNIEQIPYSITRCFIPNSEAIVFPSGVNFAFDRWDDEGNDIPSEDRKLSGITFFNYDLLELSPEPINFIEP